jgi:predicted aldo/keto reductase-like oxidoreductase
VDTIDCYMVQGVEDDWIVTMDSLYEAFSKARKAGKVRYYGLSTHTNVPKVCELAAASGRYDVIMVAVNPNSLEDLRPVIRAMREAGIGLVSMKTSGPISKDPKAFDKRYDPAVAGLKLSVYQRAYAYMLNRGGIDAFISHTPNRTILEENLAAAAVTLGQAELDAIERRTLAETRGACRHCGGCNGACPNGVRPGDLLRCRAYLHTYGDRELASVVFSGAQAAACIGCGACREVCPEAIDLPGVVSSVRTELA